MANLFLTIFLKMNHTITIYFVSQNIIKTREMINVTIGIDFDLTLC